jgi:hypothetical protein
MKQCIAQDMRNPGLIRRRAGGSGSNPGRLWRFSAELPTDLRNWFSDATLAAWIEEEVSKLSADRARPCGHSQKQVDSDCATILSLLALALASQVYGSIDIARACASEPMFRRLCQGRPPFPHELCRLRRQNRPVLERILTGLFSRAILRKFGLDSALLPGELQEDLRKHATERLDLARHVDSGEDRWELESC